MRVLDLFCGAGGAAMGLRLAFPKARIVGVDIKPQPHYCGDDFICADAIAFIKAYLRGETRPGVEYDFFWASPPCQKYSCLNGINRREYKDFIGETRFRLQLTKKPWAIENVIGAPLVRPVTLCGSQFALGVWRHRLVEVEGFTVKQKKCRHADFPQPLDVTGTGGPCAQRATPGGGLHRKPRNMAQASLAMGIDWMTRRELTQAVPPAYSRYIFQQWLEHTRTTGGSQ